MKPKVCYEKHTRCDGDTCNRHFEIVHGDEEEKELLKNGYKIVAVVEDGKAILHLK